VASLSLSLSLSLLFLPLSLSLSRARPNTKQPPVNKRVGRGIEGGGTCQIRRCIGTCQTHWSIGEVWGACQIRSGIGDVQTFQTFRVQGFTATCFGSAATVCAIPAVIYPADRARGGGIADVLVVLPLCVRSPRLNVQRIVHVAAALLTLYFFWNIFVGFPRMASMSHPKCVTPYGV
jgi:hypothetical protein